MILITGATGQLGRLAVSAIQNKYPDRKIAAGARSIEKAASLFPTRVEIRKLDYDTPSTFSGAFEGVETVVLISGSDLGQRGAQHQALIRASVEAGVQHIIYTSILNAPTSRMILAADHRDTEAAIQASGISFTILRNGWYLENYAGAIGPAQQLGQIFGASGNGKISAASRKDYADAIASAIDLSGQNTVVELAGSATFTLDDLADEIGRQLNKSVTVGHLDQPAYESALVTAGLPQPIAAVLADADACAGNGVLYGESAAFEQLIGRATQSLSDAIQGMLAH